MKQSVGVTVSLAFVVAALLFLVRSAAQRDAALAERTDLINKTQVLRDSLHALSATIDSMKKQAPGLGEYMNSIQLHLAKLWFASKAHNWGLANYELGELEENLEGAQTLHEVKNSVQVTEVLQSLRQSQLDFLHESIKQQNPPRFISAYQQTIATCNSCHRSVGYGFISIMVPTSAPVTNQRWNLVR
jgi:hypothetical protein